MSDCLPRSCPELNKHLLPEDSDSGVEAIVRNCKMKTHRQSSPLGSTGSCILLPLDVVVLHRKLTCPAVLSQLYGFCPADVSCSCQLFLWRGGAEILRKLNIILERQDFFCVFTVLIQWLPQTSGKYCGCV